MSNTQIKKRGLEVLGVIITLILLGGNHFLQEGAIKVLLQPYVMLCKLFYSVRFIYDRTYGYIDSTGRFAITEECLGNTFIAMVFILLFFRFKTYVISPGKWLGIALVLAIGIGYIVGSVRILASVPFIGRHFFGLIHGTIGIVLYLGGLIVMNSVGEWYWRKRGMK